MVVGNFSPEKISTFMKSKLTPECHQILSRLVGLEMRLPAPGLSCLCSNHMSYDCWALRVNNSMPRQSTVNVLSCENTAVKTVTVFT